MDFLKSAVASIAKGPAFAYSFGDKVGDEQSIWTLYNGTKREDGSKCSIFTFDINAQRSRLPLAKNALRKFRTLRHPGVIKVLDTYETDHLIYIATERVTPLSWSTKRKSQAEQSLLWGLYSVAKTLKFINDEASSVHGNVRVASIFVSESGEWKVGGLEILSSMKEDDAVIFAHGSLVPDIGRYAPPEIAKNGWEGVKSNPIHALDSYDYGILISEVFNGSFSGSEQVGTTKSVPLLMHNSYKRLTHAAPKMRLSIAHFLEQGSRGGSFFDTPLIQLTEGIENLGLKDDAERETFLNELETVAESDDFPETFFKVKVLPELLKAIEFGGGGPKAFALVMKISAKLSEDEYETQITPVIVRLFANPDRALRVCLLDNLPLMIDHLSQKLVTDKIFPQMVTGFGDLAPVVREQTVKAVLVVVPKLSDRVINGELLRHLAKTANDEQPGIRTNTTICLGKIAKNLGVGTRAKVLGAAFSRALRDPFVHARNAALLALAATADIFSEDECATKMLPAICPSLVDKEKLIRDQGNRTLNIYLERVRKYGATLPESVLPQQEAASAPNTRISTPQPGAGSQLMGWAISSFTNKLSSATGEIQPSSNGVRPASATRGAAAASASTNGAARPPNPQISSAPAVPKASSGLRTSMLESDAPDEDFGDGWGDMDDIAGTWGDGEETGSQHSAATVGTSASNPASNLAFDDGGEPDFEGWLNAQAQAKAQSKKALPKGLAKKSTLPSARPAQHSRSSAAGGSVKNSSTSSGSRPVTLVAATSTLIQSAAASKAPEEEDENWGDAWG